MFERFSSSARRAIFFCRQQAMERGAAEISPADLFLGLLTDPSAADPAVASLQPRTAEFRALLATPAAAAPAPDPNLPLSAGSKRALTLAARQADTDQAPEITRDHLLQGILQLDDATAVTLRAAGV